MVKQKVECRWEKLRNIPDYNSEFADNAASVPVKMKLSIKIVLICTIFFLSKCY